MHSEFFQVAGVQWPPIFDIGFHEEMVSLDMTDREAEIVWVLDKIAPMSEAFQEEMLVDVSQSLGRSPQSTSGMLVQLQVSPSEASLSIEA